MKAFIQTIALACFVATGFNGLAASTPSLESIAKTLKKEASYGNINKYMRAHFQKFSLLMQEDLDAAETLLSKMETDLSALTGTNEKATDLLKRFGTRFFSSHRGRIENARVPEADLLPALEKNPNDQKMLSIYHSRRYSELAGLVSSDPMKAETQLKELKAYYETLKQKADASSCKKIDTYLKSLARVDSRIESGKKRAAAIGKQAPPLNAEAWANGAPLTAAELKGKVVLLDFWAVWCGPCIATFPHLNEWNEKYADQGLVTVGLTRWYNYAWKGGKATRSKDVPHEEELAMLEKFAQQHKLTHRLAIQKDRSISDFFGVSGIPHAVLIDRSGKVRLMKVGSGEANAKAIGEMLATLIAEKP